MSGVYPEIAQHMVDVSSSHHLHSAPLDYLPGYAYECEIERDGFDVALFATHAIDCPESIQNAVSTRQAEFFAGRLAARSALHHLGFAQHSITLRKDRTPGWPPGIVGTISHNKHHAVACVRQAHTQDDGIGLDIEDIISEKTAQRIVGHILSADERTHLVAKCPREFAKSVTLAFSAKESLFKALYPHVGIYFDFLDVRIVKADTHTLTLQLMRTLSPQCPVGTSFTAHIYPYRGGVLTYVDLASS